MTGSHESNAYSARGLGGHLMGQQAKKASTRAHFIKI